jgi:hypothetical protein
MNDVERAIANEVARDKVAVTREPAFREPLAKCSIERGEQSGEHQQMACIVNGGYVVATSAPAQRLLFFLWALAYTLHYHPPA